MHVFQKGPFQDLTYAATASGGICLLHGFPMQWLLVLKVQGTYAILWVLNYS